MGIVKEWKSELVKRDWNSIRDMLLFCENPPAENYGDALKSLCPELRVIDYHFSIMTQAGYLDKNNLLTFAGADFLDCIRSDEVWAFVCGKIKLNGGGMPSYLVKELADNFIRGMVID